MNAVLGLQHWIYANVVHALQSLHTTGLAEMPVLIASSFAFGMLHALLPGHGKSVLASYYAGEGRLAGAIGSSSLLILVHVGTAVLMVLTGFVIVQRTIGAAGRAPELEHASQVLIVLVGLWLLWRAVRPHDHNHNRSGVVLAIVTGMVPCPLTTFIMTYAVANGLVAPGLLLSAVFAAGMIVTVGSFPLLAVLLRTRLLPLLARTERWRESLGHGLEISAALAVLAIGIGPLLGSRA
jgi:nickel/cobalt exporter